MKKKHLLALVIACFASLANVSFAQSPKTRAIATPEQMSARAVYNPAYLQPEPLPSHNINTHVTGPDRTHALTTGKTSSISAVPLGSAGNVYTCLRGEQNQVVAVDSLDLVAFIHRSNPGVFGGSSGNLRYDVSINGGTTWNNDIGPLNPLMTFVARYPNITAGNWGLGTNPLNSEFVYVANALNGGGSSFDGFVYGVSNVVTSGTPTTTEHYAFQGQNAMLPGGLCQSARGVYWFTDIEGNGSASNGNVTIYKGTYDANLVDINFVRTDTILTNPSLAFDGQPHLVGSNIAFSPDGQTGWVAWLGDPVGGGHDSVYSPVLARTTDCGLTWSSAIEVDLNTIPWIKDSLQTLWIDSLGNPASDGKASCAFDFDLTVDSDGNPHFLTVICSGSGYSVSSGLAKFMGDVTSTDGGATWDVNYISPVLCFRTQVFGGATTASMDNQPQIARDEGGCNIFYLWVDSDTCLTTGNMNGLGFGESANLAPNLRVASKNISTGMQTYPKLITDGDLIWEGAILWPTLAPIVTSDPDGWELPVVVVVMGGSNEPTDPANFFYIGNDTRIENTGWCAPASMDLGWTSFAYSSFVSPCSNPAVAFCNSAPVSPCVPVAVTNPMENGITMDDAFPNPTTGQALIGVSLPAATDLVLTLHNSLGQQVAVVAQGSFAAGKQSFRVDAAQLPAGVYFYQLRTDGHSLNKKLVVTH